MLSFLAKSILKAFARWTVGKYNPGIIGVTGTVGKTSAKEAIYAVLQNHRAVRASRGNFNSEIGLPLAILGDWRDKDLRILSREAPPKRHFARKAFFISKVIFVSAVRLLFGRGSNYPELLVLEYGADSPGDIKNLVSIAKPQIALITAIGEIPAHVEFYNSAQAVAREKARLIEVLPVTGFAILNFDDETVLNLKDRTRAHVITYGFKEGAEVRVTNFEHRLENGRPVGVAFKLEYGGSFVPVKLDGVLSKASAYAAAAAASVGIAFGMHLVRIAEALSGFHGLAHRMQLVPGIKDTIVIDDSYNASPLSMVNAIETVHKFPAARKVAVLGDMLEIGTYSLAAHERVGEQASKTFDLVICVGSHAKIIAEAARKRGMKKSCVLEYDDAEAAMGELPNLIKKGDLVLIKGSRAIHLDKVADALKKI